LEQKTDLVIDAEWRGEKIKREKKLGFQRKKEEDKD